MFSQLPIYNYMNIKAKQNHVCIEQGQMKQYIALLAYNLKSSPSHTLSPKDPEKNILLRISF